MSVSTPSLRREEAQRFSRGPIPLRTHGCDSGGTAQTQSLTWRSCHLAEPIVTSVAPRFAMLSSYGASSSSTSSTLLVSRRRRADCWLLRTFASACRMPMCSSLLLAMAMHT